MATSQQFGLSRRGSPEPTAGELIAASCFGFTPGNVGPGESVTVDYEACNNKTVPVDAEVQAVFSQGNDTAARETLTTVTLGTSSTLAPRCTGRASASVSAPSADGDYDIDVVAIVTAERPEVT